MTYPRLRRWAETVVILGLCLLTASAVAFAENPPPADAPSAPAHVSQDIAQPPPPSPAPTATPAIEPLEPTLSTQPEEPLEPTPTTQPEEPTQPDAPAPHDDQEPAPDPSPAQTAEAEVPAAAPLADKPPAVAAAPPEAEMVDICHATGSATNPFVLLTVPPGAHAGHAGDLIPAPAGGCPTGEDTSPEREKVDICHATGSATSPFVLISLPPGGLDGHDGHDGDLIPAPAEGCPIAAGPGYGVPTPEPTMTPVPAPRSPDRPDSDVAPSSDEGAAEQEPTGPAIGASSAPTAPVAVAQATSEELPFTGLDLWLIATLGLGLIMIGAGMRVLAQPPHANLAQ